MDTWARRQKVASLLRRGIEGKLAGLDHAAIPLQQAYDLAREEPLLHAPWPALTAYRLAHAKFEAADSAPALRAIEALFLEACAFGHLGPWPHVFRLAAMTRRGGGPDETLPAFEGVAAAYRSWQLRPADPGLAGLPVGTARTDLFNLVDLAACFVGAPRDALRGHGLRPDFEGTDGPHHVLVGGHPGTTDTGGLASSLAHAELGALSMQRPEALVFRMPLDGEVSWRDGEGRVEHGTGERELRLLVSLLIGDARSVEQLAERVTGRSDPAAAAGLRQARRRLRERLARAGIDLDPAELTQRDDTGRFQLLAPIPVLGLVSIRRYGNPTES